MASLYSDPITHWLAEFRAGDVVAGSRLFDVCSRHLVRVARKRLDKSRSLMQAEDVVQSCLRRFVIRVHEEGCPGVVDRKSLWAFLRKSVKNRIIEDRRRETRQRRGGGRPRRSEGLEALPDGSAAPDQAVVLDDLVEHLLSLLPSDLDLEIARLDILEQLSVEEIALAIKHAPATVYRKRERIKALWRAYLTNGPGMGNGQS